MINGGEEFSYNGLRERKINSLFNHLNSSRALWLSWKLCDFGSKDTWFKFHRSQLFISVSLFFLKVRTAKNFKVFTHAQNYLLTQLSTATFMQPRVLVHLLGKGAMGKCFCFVTEHLTEALKRNNVAVTVRKHLQEQCEEERARVRLWYRLQACRMIRISWQLEWHFWRRSLIP